MRRIGLFLFIMLVCAACNLSMYPPTGEPTYTPRPEENVPPPLTPTPAIQPTLLPLPPLPATIMPVTSAPPIGGTCLVYVTYSGSEPLNKLSLRSTPSASAPQLYRVPNNTAVMLIPTSQEIEADGYHWFNIIYVDASQTRYQGWMARDSYSVNGVRNPSIATLRPTGTQASC
jgi:hypothetical protein